MNVKMRLATTGLAATVAALTWTSVLAQQVATFRGTITLAAAGGACSSTVVGNDPDEANPERIRARRNGAIQWTVINNCAASADVDLTDWVRKADGVAATPGPPNGRLNCTVGSGQQCILTLAVRGDAEVTTYSYTVSVNGVDLDPDVIIDP